MDMFNKASMKDRIGDIKKNASLNHLKEVEKYFLKVIEKHKVEVSYDVIANELPYFKTMNYTEWAHSFMMHPLQQELRVKQLQDAYDDNCEIKADWMEYFRHRIIEGQSNKYTHIEMHHDIQAREALVVLVGSNKLKERLCLNKLRWIKNRYDDDVWFKPHPLTTHQLVGELKDLFGDKNVLERDLDMYAILLESETIFTSHMSESAVYAVALDKRIEPIDVYNKVEQGSFYHVNKYLFTVDEPKTWINRALNSPKCGIVNPEIEENWQKKIDMYIEYIMAQRNKHKNKYV